jgi:DNA-binding transcriptional regulator YhcF (GntR family)/uncharacterized small protein (DUF1192 family)
MSPANPAKPDRRPPYQHAADAIRREIKAGRFKPGEQLPSYRELQERFGIANMTARSALQVLREEGLVHTIPGRGSFVADTGEGEFSIDYTAPAWYLQNSGQATPLGEAESKPRPKRKGEGESGDSQAAGTVTELLATLTALRDEIRQLNADHQALRKEVEELKAQHRKERGNQP